MTSPFEALGLQVLERNWLSSNQTVFLAADGTPATVVDTGHARHATQTLALLQQALQGAALARIVNTHLHSDHCGGNHNLQRAYPEGLSTWVPAASVSAVATWDQAHLSHQATGQHCPPFQADRALEPGSCLQLGPAQWQVWAAPGHDPDAMMLYEPQTRTLIAGDALWEERLAIIFPELEARPGFAATRATLDLIERLAPRWVIPGHGPVFEDVAGALACSRQRLDAFEAQPERHLRHAARALTLFHMMELEHCARCVLEDWMARTPLLCTMARQLGLASDWATRWVDELLNDQLLFLQGDQVQLHRPI